jgi:hypothetical protein
MPFTLTPRRVVAAILAFVLGVFVLTGSSCDDTDNQASKERNKVNEQQLVYSQNQPVPKYDFSLARHLWIQFYDSQNKQVTTYSYISGMNGGAPMFDCASMGFALPRDTQLTAPTAKVPDHDAVVDQAEPNGLFTSKNTDSTIVFCLNKNGSVSPVYTEHKVDAFPFPVKWVTDADYPQGHFVRTDDSSSIELNPNK